MSNILDDNNLASGEGGHSALAISRLKTIGSRSRMTGILQMGLFGLVILLLLYVLVAGASIMNAFASMGARGGANLGNLGGLLFAVVGLLLVIFGLYFFSAFKLMSYGNKVNEFVESGNPTALEEATSSRKVYFMITVIFSILSLLANVYFMFAGPGAM